MNHYVGIDVSLEASSVCLVDGTGKIVCEGKIASEPPFQKPNFNACGNITFRGEYARAA